MKNKLIRRLKGYLSEIGFDGDGHYIAAVSGGSDSVAMLYAMLGILARDRLAVLHINHHTRGIESDSDQRFVERIAKDLGLRCIVRDVVADESEGALRAARLTVYAEVADAQDADILVGHTASDSAETALFNLVRGTGLRGIGIAPTTALGAHRIVRPVLFATRDELRAFLSEHGIPWREDASNADTTYSRNFIRHNVLPLFAERFGDDVAMRIAASARMAQAAADALSSMVNEVAKRTIEPLSIGIIRLSRGWDNNSFIAGELIRLAVERTGAGLRQFDLDTVRRVMNSKRAEVYGGLHSERYSGRLYIYGKLPRLTMPLALWGEKGFVPVPGYGVLTYEIVERPFDLLHHDGILDALIAIPDSEPLIVRLPNVGERIIPFAGTERSVMRFLSERGFPRFMRERAIIVGTERDVVWAIGAGISNRYRVLKSAKFAMRLSFEGRWARLVDGVKK